MKQYKWYQISLIVLFSIFVNFIGRFFADTVSGSMEEMQSGAKEINYSAQNVSDMAIKTMDNISKMSEVVSKFKLQ